MYHVPVRDHAQRRIIIHASAGTRKVGAFWILTMIQVLSAPESMHPCKIEDSGLKTKHRGIWAEPALGADRSRCGRMASGEEKAFESPDVHHGPYLQCTPNPHHDPIFREPHILSKHLPRSLGLEGLEWSPRTTRARERGTRTIQEPERTNIRRQPARRPTVGRKKWDIEGCILRTEAALKMRT